MHGDGWTLAFIGDDHRDGGGDIRFDGSPLRMKPCSCPLVLTYQGGPARCQFVPWPSMVDRLGVRWGIMMTSWHSPRALEVVDDAVWRGLHRWFKRTSTPGPLLPNPMLKPPTPSQVVFEAKPRDCSLILSFQVVTLSSSLPSYFRVNFLKLYFLHVLSLLYWYSAGNNNNNNNLISAFSNACRLP